MATNITDVYKHATDFAHANMGVVSNKELLTKALAEFDKAGFPNDWWEFWTTEMTQVRDKLKGLVERQKAQLARQPATAIATIEVKG